ncbi:uncharacterized protein LOC131172753 [Hevea brasiliensis]|uniref:uncharacterized protein LOC131172753 n=1 Tax=Hevea brasiliensis TaxID=3981 RepID=UPI0025E7F6D0|nr:uncharacterized protein LOC131172753 [Hevea brasiliensis]
MGKDIVIQECEQPGGRSRLWNYEDVNHVLIIETAAVSMQLSAVKTLNDSNFDDWKESLSMYLAIAQLDLALRVDAHTKLTDESIIAPVLSSEKLSKAQCPQDDKERIEMENIPYGSAVESLIYAQVCTHPDIAFAISVLGRYLSNRGWSHWKATKKVKRYL